MRMIRSTHMAGIKYVKQRLSCLSHGHFCYLVRVQHVELVMTFML